MLTLFVIPCVYTIVAGFIDRMVIIKAKVVPVFKPEPLAPKPKQDVAAELALPREAKPKVKPSIIKKEEVARPEIKPIPMPPPPAPSRLNKRQEQLLEHLKTAGKITRKEYAEFFKVSVPTAARDLKELLDKGFLIAHGPLGPGRWYELKK